MAGKLQFTARWDTRVTRLKKICNIFKKFYDFVLFALCDCCFFLQPVCGVCLSFVQAGGV